MFQIAQIGNKLDETFVGIFDPPLHSGGPKHLARKGKIKSVPNWWSKEIEEMKSILNPPKWQEN